MIKDLPLSEVRKNLSRLLQRLRKERNFKVRITVNGIPAGELRAIDEDRPQVNAGEALLRAARLLNNGRAVKSGKTSTAEEHDRFLYPSRT